MLEKRLEEISQLKENWDSYGAKPINKNVIEMVRKIIPYLDDTFYLIPTHNGEIQIGTHKNNFDLEIVFKINDKLEFYLETSNRPDTAIYFIKDILKSIRRKETLEKFYE